MDGSALDQRLESAFDPRIFQSGRRIEVEIGCGKGKFLIARSQQRPEDFFIGVDRIAKWMKIGQRRGEKRNLQNLRFVKFEIRELLKQIPPDSIACFHIYFPDPWPKRRHRKRRLVNPSFLAELHARLQPAGFVDLATDDSDYFRQMKESVSQELWESSERLNQRFESEIEEERAKTNYELKYESAGKPLYYLRLKKKANA